MVFPSTSRLIRRRSRRAQETTFFLIVAAALAFFLVQLTSCSQTQDHPLLNQPPDTEITHSPLDGAITGYRVELHWTGHDSDGVIDHFQWRISDNGPDGVLDVADTLGLPWHTTVAWDSTFVVTADLDSVLPGSTEPVLARRSHTFFVRAVDGEGVADPTPACISFTATTWTPEIHFDPPSSFSGSTCKPAGTSLAFGWKGSDPDGPEGIPLQCRWALVEVSRLDPRKLAEAGLSPLPYGTCLSDADVDALNPVGFFPEDVWSPWLDYRDETTPTPPARVDDLPAGSTWFLAVQARDEAGAVTPDFHSGRNLLHFMVKGDTAPTVTVWDEYLHQAVFDGTHQLEAIEVFAGETVTFHWMARTEGYLGDIAGYRYGWNVIDPEDPDDPGWVGPFTPDTTSATLQLPEGTTTFTVQAKDGAGTVTTSIVQLDAQRSFTDPLRPVLLVEDYGLDDTPQQQEIQQSWSDAWDRVLTARLPGYDPDLDHIVLYAGEAGPGIDAVSSYANIIWTFRGRGDMRSRWFTGTSPTGFHYNWLWAHQRLRGGVLLAGPAAAWSILPYRPETLPIDLRDPYTRFDFAVIDVSHCWLRQAWGVTVIDHVDGGAPRADLSYERSWPCDGLVLARTGAAAAPLGIGELRPAPPRIPPFPDLTLHLLPQEEFYDRDLRPGRDPVPADLHETIFVWEALRDSPWMDPQTTCALHGPGGLSGLNGAATGVVRPSTPALRPDASSAQILWGFHPLAFEEDDLGLALAGIFAHLWGLPVR